MHQGIVNKDCSIKHNFVNFGEKDLNKEPTLEVRLSAIANTLFWKTYIARPSFHFIFAIELAFPIKVI